MTGAVRIAVVALACLLGPGAALAGAAPSVGVADSLTTVRPTDPFSGPPSAAISAARNEFESFQVVISAPDAPLDDAGVAVSEPFSGPGGTIPLENITVYREEYLDLRRPSDLEGATGRWPDALIPSVDPWFGEVRDAFPVDIPAGENRVAWIDVLVPPDQPAGVYQGELAITSASGFETQVPMQLTVRDFGLPSTSTLASAFGMDFDVCPGQFNGPDCFPNERRGWALKSLYVRVALENRVTISNSAFQPPVGHEIALFRRHLLPLLQGGSPQNDAGTLTPVRLAGAELTSIQVDGGPFLNAERRFAASGGFTDRAFFYACDEPGRDRKLWAACKRRARSVRRWPDLETLVTAPIQEADRFKATRLLDILVPIVNHIDDKPPSPFAGNQRPAYNPFLAQPDNRLWLYNACPSHGCADDGLGKDPYFAGWPSYAIDQPAFQHRAMGVLAFGYGASGELYFQTTHALRTAWTRQYFFGGNGDGTLFYPGRPSLIGGSSHIPVESIRLKRIRDGREDYEYLYLLALAGQGDAALAAAWGLLPTPYAADIPAATVTAFRDQLAAQIEGG